MFQKPVNSATLLRTESQTTNGSRQLQYSQFSRHVRANRTVIQQLYGAGTLCAQMSTSNCIASPNNP